MASLSIDHISVRFKHNGLTVRAVSRFSLDVESREFVCLVGPSGCGKTTILNVVAGFIKPYEGNVRVTDTEITGPGADRGYVFQKHNLFPWKTVFGNIAFGLRMKHMPPEEIDFIVNKYIREVGLTEFRNSYPTQLSGGQQQRIGLARSYANDPHILLMDEPFASLDAQIAMKMRDLLMDLWSKDRKTVLFVTHNVDEAIMLADRIILLTARPASVRRIMNVDIPRPRTIETYNTPEFIEMRRYLLSQIFDANLTHYR